MNSIILVRCIYCVIYISPYIRINVPNHQPDVYIVIYIYTNSFLAGHITWMIPSRHLFLSCTLTRKAQQPRGLQPESYVNTLLIDAIT